MAYPDWRTDASLSGLGFDGDGLPEKSDTVASLCGAACQALADRLASQCFRFDFVQAVRLLQQLYPEKKPVGHEGLPGLEVVRFAAHQSLSFPASSIYSLELPSDDGPARMTVNFMGLTGPSGVLPDHYTELILQRLVQRTPKDTAFRDFLDLFNHRLISLFYRACEKYRPPFSYERAASEERQVRTKGPPCHRAFLLDRRPQIDRFAQAVLDLIGLGTSAVRYDLRARSQLGRRIAASDDSLRFFSGILAQRHRSVAGLKSLLEGYFRLSVKVVPFCGQWLSIDPGERTRLCPGSNNKLGTTAVAGSRVWDVKSKFRVEIGPLSYEQFASLLPDGSAHRPLGQLVRLYAGGQFDFDIQLSLAAQEVPRCRLGGHGDVRLRLGWNTWLGQALRGGAAPVTLRFWDERTAEDAAENARDNFAPRGAD